MNRPFKTALAAAGLAASLVGQAASSEPARPAVPDRAPDGSSYYPDRARRQEINGDVLLRCRAVGEAALADCRAVYEWPLAYAFADFALRMVADHPDLRPVESMVEADGQILVPINFAMADYPRTSFHFLPGASARIVFRTDGAPVGDLKVCLEAKDCKVAAFTWAARPGWRALAALVRPAQGFEGFNRLDCATDPRGGLVDCEVKGEQSPAKLALMLKVAATFRAPVGPETPASRKVLLFFDWGTIGRVVPALDAAEPAPPKAPG
ncbi:hypothetical protein [Caulobacter sp. NIBR1757]|uniref:hypothetical protein n=1 Tax=Caulobacter sp. NIBR1757 TaxID=3016000 RepID=UPI0022F09E34|nr:hypothetical protein [Caulobacter sp. NIBR1757]